jgi:hypothetical protein
MSDSEYIKAKIILPRYYPPHGPGDFCQTTALGRRFDFYYVISLTSLRGTGAISNVQVLHTGSVSRGWRLFLAMTYKRSVLILGSFSFLSTLSFWAKGGQRMVALRGGKRPFSVCICIKQSTAYTYANTKQPVVLTAFAAVAMCD